MSKPQEKRSDSLLWLATAGVVGLTATWLLISKPWSSSATVQLSNPGIPEQPLARDELIAPSEPSVATTELGSSDTASEIRISLDNPLRMAQLAYDAGMLIEPEEYSAWALFNRALEEDPRDATARLGLERVAQELVKRGEAAAEQGRLGDATTILERVQKALPEHEGALALAGRVNEAAPLRARPGIVAPSAPTAPEPEPQAVRRPVRRVPEPAEPAPEPEPPRVAIAELHEAFTLTMTQNQLLAPANSNAKHFVDMMLADNPVHELTLSARDLLATEMLSRSTQSVEALDWDAARTWINEAELLAPGSTMVANAREQLNLGMIAAESNRRVPVTALTVRSAPPPEYPRTALSRQAEGWVEVEFRVTADGTTQDVTVSDASHERLFRNEAIEAIENWEFEPRIFLGTAIPQRSYVRLRFSLQD